jgi:hypothetical protein
MRAACPIFFSCRLRPAGIVAVSLAIAAIGCSRGQSTAERIEDEYKRSGLKRVAVYPLAGKVIVDNETPAPNAERSAFVVMAYDTSKADAPAGHNAFVTAQPDGSFEFPDGGLPPGKYVMLFAQLKGSPKRGYGEPDALKNLYNDPDVNGKKPEFNIDHQAPGKTDCAFNLSVAGETSPATPGARALTKIPR